MRKYGIEHFHIEQLEETKNPEEQEIYWIKYYDSYHNGYNATQGGDGKRLYDYELILEQLQQHPYPCDIAKMFNCCPDLVYEIAKQNKVEIKNKAQEELKKTSKNISAFSKQGELVATFPSVAEAAKWCYNNGKCLNLNSGVRGHIADAANGKRQTAYTYIWKYK